MTEDQQRAADTLWDDLRRERDASIEPDLGFFRGVLAMLALVALGCLIVWAFVQAAAS